MTNPNSERVAVVGLAGLFPGAADAERLWQNVLAGVDASSEPPAGRWTIPPDEAYHPEPGRPDAVSSRRGYFLDPFEPDLTGLDIDPDLVRRLDPLYHLVLHVGGRAFRDARMEPVERRRVGVVLGSIVLPTDAANRVGEAPAATARYDRSTSGLPAALLANALNLGLGGYALDAACASSLYAVKLAADELLAGRADAMLAGGVSRPDCLYTQMGFSQIRALSPTGRCSPFDASADGLVVGEGGCVFVLKRLTDALRHGDNVYGVIAGIGLSNDVAGNLLLPASEGQVRAMRAAYREAGWSPRDVDYVECHATGTPVGDAVEFASLRELWGDAEPGSCVAGAVKSTVGHLLTGAGAAGLAKSLFALRDGTLPPTANFRTPSAKLGYESSPFRLLAKPAEWPRRRGRPRRAAVSGFGFGGINAHLLVEEWQAGSPREAAVRSADGPVAVVGLAMHVGPRATLPAVKDAVLGDGSADAGRIDAVAVPVAKFRTPPREAGRDAAAASPRPAGGRRRRGRRRVGRSRRPGGHRRLRRPDARPERDELSPALVGTGGHAGRRASAADGRPDARAHWAAWRPAAWPGGSGPAGRRSPSVPRRRPGCGRSSWGCGRCSAAK